MILSLSQIFDLNLSIQIEDIKMLRTRNTNLFPSQRPKNLYAIAKAALTKSFIFLLITIPLIFEQSLVFANTAPANQIITASVFPSANPLSAKYIQSLHDTQNKAINAGYTMEDLNKLFLVIDHRDQAWAMAKTIIQAIQAGQDISKYATDKLKSEIITRPFNILPVLSTVKSLGSKLNLSTQFTQGRLPDYMKVYMRLKQDDVTLTVVDVFGRMSMKSTNDSGPFKQLEITLSSKYPYKNWSLAGIHITEAQVIKPS